MDFFNIINAVSITSIILKDIIGVVFIVFVVKSLNRVSKNVEELNKNCSKKNGWQKENESESGSGTV